MPSTLALLIIGPALVSAFVSSTVAFLLARLRRDPVFSSFGWFALALGAYGLVDGLVSVLPADLTSMGYVTLAAGDLVLVTCLAPLLIRLTDGLLGRRSSRRWAGFAAVVVFAALSTLALTWSAWTVAALAALGGGFMLALFAIVIISGIRLIAGWRRIHDRLFRRILVATGVLLVAFVPLWLLDIFGHVGLLSFYWFLLAWNVGALVLAARAFFEPAPAPPQGLFLPESLEACAQRFGLTPRETEVTGLHAQGFSAKDIGERLFIAPKTVRNHISNVYEKTGRGERRELLELLRQTSPSTYR